MKFHVCPLADLVRSFDGAGPGPVWAAYDRLRALFPAEGEIADAAEEFETALNARLTELHNALRACDGLPPRDRAL